jgi:GNAT superfamily N-acetyltransferase
VGDLVTYHLDALTASDCELARLWRNEEGVRLGLRTPHVLTTAMQSAFYQDVVSNRRAPHRYWAVRPADGSLAAMVGLTDISFENGHAEVSLLVDPKRTGQGVGETALDLVLREGFDNLRLNKIVGEVYTCNPALGFWQKQVERFKGGGNTEPDCKFWGGHYHAGWRFWIMAAGYRRRSDTFGAAIQEITLRAQPVAA